MLRHASLARGATTSRRSVACHSSVDRRAVLGVIMALPLLASRAEAKDYDEAKKEKEARRAALRAAATSTKKDGEDKTDTVFKMPEYSVSEEARTPNIHSRQGEGARTQENI